MANYGRYCKFWSPFEITRIHSKIRIFSPKSENSKPSKDSPRIGSAGTGSGSGTEKDKSSGSTGKNRSAARLRRPPLPTSSSSEDEYEQKRKIRSQRRNSRDILEYRSSTNPRKSKSSPKNLVKQRHKSSENILENSTVAKNEAKKCHSEGEVLEEKPVAPPKVSKNRENFDFTSNRSRFNH